MNKRPMSAPETARRIKFLPASLVDNAELKAYVEAKYGGDHDAFYKQELRKIVIESFQLPIIAHLGGLLARVRRPDEEMVGLLAIGYNDNAQCFPVVAGSVDPGFVADLLARLLDTIGDHWRGCNRPDPENAEGMGHHLVFRDGQFTYEDRSGSAERARLARAADGFALLSTTAGIMTSLYREFLSDETILALDVLRRTADTQLGEIIEKDKARSNADGGNEGLET